MSDLGLTGLASGVDTSGIVDKLMSVERAKRDKMDLTKSSLSAKGKDLSTIQTKLLALSNATAALRDVGTWANTQTVESSDAKVTATRTSGAGPGGYAVDVLALAKSEQHSYTFTSSSAASTLQLGSTQVNLAAGATIDDAVSQINSTATAPVYAANVNGQLVLSARTTGTASAFTATGDTLSNETIKAGTDAQYTIDGGAVQTSSSNQVANAIPGVTLTFKGVTSSASITIGAPGVDKDSIKTKAQAFVDAYNDLVKTTRGYLDEQPVAGASTSDDAAKGALYGDTGLTSMLSQMRQAVSNVVAGNGTSMDELREFGISTGSATGGTSTDDSKTGLLTLDSDTLDAALDANPLGVRQMLGGVTGSPGFAQRFEGIIKSYTGPTGVLTHRLSQSDSDLKDLQDQMTAEDTRLSDTQARLQAQFAAMETALANAQSQGSWLTSQIASLG